MHPGRVARLGTCGQLATPSLYREQETLGDAGDYQDTTASTRGRDDRHADDDLTKGPPAAGRRAATDRDGGVRRGRPVTECTGHAEATREPTETSGVAETRGVEAAVLWTPLRAAHRTWNTGRPVFHKLPHPSLSRFCATELDGHNPGKWTFLLWRKADISTLVRHWNRRRTQRRHRGARRAHWAAGAEDGAVVDTPGTRRLAGLFPVSVAIPVADFG